jgi:hypothetical protein
MMNRFMPTMKTTCIRLKPEWRLKLMGYVQIDSEIWNALRHASPIDTFLIFAGRHYEVICGEAGARVLLHVAKKHCPEAMLEIELAIQRLQMPRP